MTLEQVPPDTVTASEKPFVKRFTEEARRTLKEKGFVIFQLSGKTLGEQIAEGMKVNPRLQMLSLDLPEKPDFAMEVAINPLEVISERAGFSDFGVMQKNVVELSKMIEAEIPGTRMVIGSAGQYAEMASIGNQGQTDIKPVDAATRQGWTKFILTTTTAFDGRGCITIGPMKNGVVQLANTSYEGQSPLRGVAPLIIPS